MKKFFFIVAVCIPSIFLNAQNVSISATGIPPDPSAGLDVNFTDKGLLIPRVSLTSTTDNITVPSPTNALLVYNTDTAGSGVSQVFPGFYYWDASSNKWRRIIDDKYSVHLTSVKTASFAAGAYPANTWFKIPFVGIYVDNMGASDIANGRVVVQETGWYQISYAVTYCPQTTHYTHTRVYLNGFPFPNQISNAMSPTASGCRTNSHSFYAFLNANDILELYGFDSQNSPTAGLWNGFFTILKIH